MITSTNPKLDTAFTLYWSKYFYPHTENQKAERERIIDTILTSTEKYKNKMQGVSEYDAIAYLQ